MTADELSQSSNFAANLKEDYEKLPDLLKKCFEYCCICIRYSMEKKKLVRLLLAEGLVQENSEYVMEDLAENFITELISKGMLRQEHDGFDVRLQVSSLHRKLSLIKLKKHDFVANNTANLPLRMVIIDDGKGINPSLKGLLIRSLFLVTAERMGLGLEKGLSRASMETICGFLFLLVLDLDGKVDYLPNEVGDLVHLRYLGLENSDLNELPSSLGNLQKLQTLDIRMCGKLYQLPVEVLKIQQLRHLLMSNSIGDCEIKVPKGIGMLKNLRTCTGVYAGDGIASELSSLPQLRELGVKRVSDDHSKELYAAIVKMENLTSLSLEAEETFFDDERFSLLPEFEEFSPPPLLQELYLHGGLIEIPTWLSTMTKLICLTLSFSYLQEMSTSVLQVLPKLKHLALWEAYKGNQIRKEFCESGGFPELETLTIASGFLVEWTEIENGAFPKLKSLTIRNCLNFRFLSEGLQNISTLEKLDLSPMHEDLAWRLLNEDSYKIKNISTLCAGYRNKFNSTYVGNPKEVLLRI